MYLCCFKRGTRKQFSHKQNFIHISKFIWEKSFVVRRHKAYTDTGEVHFIPTSSKQLQVSGLTFFSYNFYLKNVSYKQSCHYSFDLLTDYQYCNLILYKLLFPILLQKKKKMHIKTLVDIVVGLFSVFFFFFWIKYW